ncbi:MAG: hypothetical protein ACI902_002980 [Psychroserpens sp.]|jgi:hypothetical protein
MLILSVIDISGSVLGTCNGQTTIIDISSWSPCVYFMKFSILTSEVINQIITKQLNA